MSDLHFTPRFALFAAVALMSAGGCTPTPDASGDEQSKGLPPVSFVQAWTSDMQRVVELPFTIEGYESAELMAKIDGFVGSVDVNIGDRVSQGQVLATLDVPEMDNEMTRKEMLAEQASAEIRLAEAKTDEHKALVEMRKLTVSRLQQLVEAGSINEEKLDEAKYELAAARASLARSKAEVAAASAHAKVAEADREMSRTMGSYRVIRAPFYGLVTKRNVDPGDFVQPASQNNAKPLFKVVRVDKVRVVAYLPMETAGRLDDKDPFVIDRIESQPGAQLDSVDGKPLTFVRHSSSFDSNSRMMRAEADVDNATLEKASGMQLKPGDYGQLHLTLDFPQVATVPTGAVGSDINGSFVIRLTPDNKCEKVSVEVCAEAGDILGLEAGEIAAGDRLVAADLGGVADGHSVTADRLIVAERPTDK